MRQCTDTQHVLQRQERINGEWCSWAIPQAAIYRPAILLAYHGRIINAIEEAERIQIKNYGDMHNVRFRVLTTARTVTVTAGPIETELLDPLG